MTIRPALFALMIALPVSALAQVPRNLPLTVRKAVTALDSDCRRYHGRPGRSPNLLKIADLNADGIRDYMTDLNHYVCTGAASAMGSGQSGAVLTIYVGGPANSAIQVYQATVRGSRIENAGGKARLFVDVGGADCGQSNAARIPFARWQYCSRELVWNAARQSFGFAPLSQKRRIR